MRIKDIINEATCGVSEHFSLRKAPKDPPWPWVETKEKIDDIVVKGATYDLYADFLSDYQYWQIKDGDVPAAQIVLKKGPRFWSMHQSQSDPAYRGKGLMMALIHYIIQDKKTAVISDDVMTDDAMTFVKSIVARGQVKHFVYDSLDDRKITFDEVERGNGKWPEKDKMPDDNGRFRFFYLFESIPAWTSYRLNILERFGYGAELFGDGDP